MTEYIYNNTIIFDGTTEYYREEIENDEALKPIRNGFLILGGLTALFESIEKDSGQIYITTDGNLKNQMLDLRDVSPETMNKFRALNI